MHRILGAKAALFVRVEMSLAFVVCAFFYLCKSKFELKFEAILFEVTTFPLIGYEC